LRINQQIRGPTVRVIDENGGQLGVITIEEAQKLAEEAKLDLVEVVPTAAPPVCKIIDYGKYRYDQTKREKDKYQFSDNCASPVGQKTAAIFLYDAFRLERS